MDWIEDLAQELRAAGDGEVAARQQAYMRDQFPFLGVQTPERRRICRSFFTAANQERAVDWAAVARCWQLPEREYQYVAADYLGLMEAYLAKEDLLRIRELIVDKPWWDTIDALDRVVGNLVLRYPDLAGAMRAWSRDENLWIRRVAIDHQLMRKSSTDTALLEEVLVNNLDSTEFFINKAIGWALRDYSKTDPAWVRAFIEKYRSRMSALSIREGGKYI